MGASAGNLKSIYSSAVASACFIVYVQPRCFAASSVCMLNLYGVLVFWSEGCLMICRVCLSIAS
jgi:hypothetical protein